MSADWPLAVVDCASERALHATAACHCYSLPTSSRLSAVKSGDLPAGPHEAHSAGLAGNAEPPSLLLHAVLQDDASRSGVGKGFSVVRSITDLLLLKESHLVVVDA